MTGSFTPTPGQASPKRVALPRPHTIRTRRCDQDEAFALLMKLSRDTNTKLHDVVSAFLDEFRATCHAAPPGPVQPPPDGGPAS
ncbi:ANTAR domain-containing protein [Amycolatopsis sp. NPDC051903]|uniref:ANTAR domain-containing protein n=1 Tax=Amycolatopsis sp. NPDC051903 TaxID=3363936 RepID=UPI0037B7C8BD